MKPEIYIGDKSATAANLFKAMVAEWPHETEIEFGNGDDFEIIKTWKMTRCHILVICRLKLFEAAEFLEQIKPTEIVNGDETIKIDWECMQRANLITAIKEHLDEICEKCAYWEFESVTI